MERNQILDNAKLFLVATVILGHLLEPMIPKKPTLKAIYFFIYSFHMPSLIFISGTVSKVHVNKLQFKRNIATILLPFLVFTVLYEFFNFVLVGEISNYTRKLQPYWILWFLFSLFIWRSLLPVVSKCRYSFFMAVAAAVGVGYIDTIGYQFGLSRTIYFFPFFLAGHLMRPRFFTKIRNSDNYIWIVSGSLSVLLFTACFFYYMSDLQQQWLWGSYSYSRLGTSGWIAGGMRLFFLSISFLTTISMLNLIPEIMISKKHFGENTLYVYVWHGFLIQFLGKIGFFSILEKFSLLSILVICSMLTGAFTMLLSCNYTKKYTQQVFLRPVEKLLFERDMTSKS